MIGRYTASQVISPAGETVFKLDEHQGAYKLEAEMFPFHEASVTVTCSGDYVGGGEFSINQGNEKGGAFYPISGTSTIELAAGSRIGVFDIKVTGKYLTLNSAPFVITAGSVLITVIGKR